MFSAIIKTKLLQFFANDSLNVRSNKINGEMYLMILNSVSEEFYRDMIIEYLDSNSLQYANTLAAMITSGMKCIGIEVNRNKVVNLITKTLKDIDDKNIQL